MWTLGLATVVVAAAIALLVKVYLAVSSAADPPDAGTAKPLKRLAPARQGRSAREGRVDMRTYPVRVVPEGEGAVMLLFPDVPEAVVVGRSEDDAFDRAVPVLEAVLTGYVDEGRPLPAASDICGAPTVSSARFA
jgi:predicted RNase H-like HicB family nuclease